MSSEDNKVPTFKKATIHEIFKQVWMTTRLTSIREGSEPIPKINEIGLVLSVEYLRLFTIEAFHRSIKVAIEEEGGEEEGGKSRRKVKEKSKRGREGEGEEFLDDEDEMKDDDQRFNHDLEGHLVEVKHLQKISPGLLLDF